MSEYLELNSYTPQQTTLNKIIKKLEAGGVIAYPTDSGYALGCKLGLKKPLQVIKSIRQLSDTHNFTLMCRDLSEISHYAKVDNSTYRTLKKCTPGSYTFILQATREVPTLTLNKSKKTIGIRISDHDVPNLITAALNAPILSSTLILPGFDMPIVYADDIPESLMHDIDIVISSDYCGYESTTVIDFTSDIPKTLRVGAGAVLF